MFARLQREAALLREYGRLIRREPGKFVRQAVRDYSLRFTGIAPGLQPANVACRIVDDIADGERELLPEFASFPELIQRAKQQIESGRLEPGSQLLALLHEAVYTVERRELTTGETRESFSGLLDAMLVEYCRRVDRTLLPRQTLIEIHTDSSFHAHNIALICLGSRNRARDTPELAEFIGRIGVLRDLPKDLRLGIINIPQEVLPDGCRAEELIAHAEEVPAMPQVMAWMRDELRDGSALAEKLRGYRLDRAATVVTNNVMRQYLWIIEQRLKTQQ